MQCREFLQQHPNIKVVEGEDTARSAEMIKEGDLKGHAAICSKVAAERYGMKILQESIETNKHNFTRFLIVADPWQVDELSRHHSVVINKASMVFTLPHTEGSLSQVLSILSFYNINLTKYLVCINEYLYGYPSSWYPTAVCPTLQKSTGSPSFKLATSFS